MASGSQQQTVEQRAIGVQNVGDGNTIIVYAGRSELALLRKHSRKVEPKTELQLLRVDLRATTLIGRERDLSALEAWLASDRLISLRCITGRAGAGKTRLAIELCESAEQAGWTAGFAQYGQFSEFVKHAGEWRWNKPILVVIDYAAALARDLRTWLEILARPEAHAGGNKLRLLLLERHAEREVGWWADLMRTVSFSDPAPDELADPPEPVPLLSLNAVEDRRRLLSEAMRLAGQIAGLQPSPHPPLPGANADFDRRLGDDTINNEPLYLMMAGAESIRTGAAAALALTRTDLAERAASRERERLNRLALQWGLSDKLVAHLAMCVTLQGGCSAEDALQLVTDERRAMGFPETGPAVHLVDRLGEALSMPGGAAVDAVRPDLIGEAFLQQGIAGAPSLPEGANGNLGPRLATDRREGCCDFDPHRPGLRPRRQQSSQCCLASASARSDGRSWVLDRACFRGAAKDPGTARVCSGGAEADQRQFDGSGYRRSRAEAVTCKRQEEPCR
jgi:hypothetical protein